MTQERTTESLMEETGLGLLPGLVAAMTLAVLAMALLLLGSMWAVLAVLALVVGATVAVVGVVIALTDESPRGERLRTRIPGL